MGPCPNPSAGPDTQDRPGDEDGHGFVRPKYESRRGCPAASMHRRSCRGAGRTDRRASQNRSEPLFVGRRLEAKRPRPVVEATFLAAPQATLVAEATFLATPETALLAAPETTLTIETALLAAPEAALALTHQVTHALAVAAETTKDRKAPLLTVIQAVVERAHRIGQFLERRAGFRQGVRALL